ncbi:MAG: GNAT family N-acetyltransferase, partial [Faecousia sp.]
MYGGFTLSNPPNLIWRKSMENKLKFTQVVSDNAYLCSEFCSLMHPYIKELNEHSKHTLSDEFIEKWISSILSMQGPPDRHLELCYDGQELIGFLYGKIDHEDHNGFIKPGYGYIMEFFVLPQFRRKGYGKAMFHHMEKLFTYDGAQKMYLTPDAVTGVPFWTAMEFQGTGEYSPENQMVIFEKAVRMDLGDGWILQPLSGKAAAEMANWAYEAPYDAYSFKGDQDDYLLDESTWGTEQFCLMDGETVIGQVACQFEGSDLWVGWSMNPAMVGKGYGSIFVRKCVEEIRRAKKHTGRLLLRVAAWNQRAIKAYQKA